MSYLKDKNIGSVRIQIVYQKLFVISNYLLNSPIQLIYLFNADLLTWIAPAVSVSAMSALDFKFPRGRLCLSNLLCRATNNACYENRFSMCFDGDKLHWVHFNILCWLYFKRETSLSVYHTINPYAFGKKKTRYEMYLKFISELSELY